MKLRAEKINHIAHLITSFLAERDDVTLYEDKNDIRLQIKDLITSELKIEEDIDKKTRKILESYSRPIPEGSREWDIMYQKTFEEEMDKRRKSS